MPTDIRDVDDLVRSQERWRGRETINLIASENAQSRAVRDVQNSDFMARYAEGHPNEEGRINRYYQGTRFIDEIERKARREIIELFGVFGRRIQIRGQTLTAGRDNSVRLHFLPLTPDKYHMDAAGALEMIDRIRPQLVVLGKSLFLFPEPLAELVPVCREWKIPIL